MRRLASRTVLVLAAIAAGLLLVELGMRATRLDGRMFVRVLYYQGGRLEQHEPVEDPDLLYRLRPGSQSEMTDRSGRACPLAINEQGARSPAWTTDKPDDVTRILLLGASTVFGVGVCDDQTLSAALGRALDAKRPDRRHEVWNFGTSAYTSSQVVHRGALELQAVPDADLLVLLPTNVGRRPFLVGELEQKLDYYAQFRADPVLWLENFYLEEPWPGLSKDTTNRLHWGWLRFSALYRYLAVRSIPRDRTNMGWNPYVAKRAADLAEQLERRAAERDVGVAWVLWPQEGADLPGFQERGYPFGSRWISLERPGLTAADRDLHPPAESLAAHAAYLADRLVEEGWLD